MDTEASQSGLELLCGILFRQGFATAAASSDSSCSKQESGISTMGWELTARHNEVKMTRIRHWKGYRSQGLNIVLLGMLRNV